MRLRQHQTLRSAAATGTARASFANSSRSEIGQCVLPFRANYEAVFDKIDVRATLKSPEKCQLFLVLGGVLNGEVKMARCSLGAQSYR